MTDTETTTTAAADTTEELSSSSSWITKSLEQAPPPDPFVTGWILRQSRSMPGTHYYYHQETGYSQWDAPVVEQQQPRLEPIDTKKKKRTELSKRPSSETATTAEAPAPNKRSKGADLKEVRVLHLLKKHKGSRRPASWRNPKITSTLEEATAELEEFVAILKESQDAPEEMRATFEELARTESDCSSAKRGGDLGFFGRKKMQPAFEKAAFALEIGELSHIVETSSGVHILLRIG